MLELSDTMELTKDGAAWSFEDMVIDDQEFGTMFVKSPVINFIPWKDRRDESRTAQDVVSSRPFELPSCLAAPLPEEDKKPNSEKCAKECTMRGRGGIGHTNHLGTAAPSTRPRSARAPCPPRATPRTSSWPSRPVTGHDRISPEGWNDSAFQASLRWRR